ncbi:hypothetical protein GMRT_12529 [Giardia muris]|uniref:Uncharacterized protein n=1 Tax=Giardia muris TaxID=5742 RepID=A0A4Z1T5J2_GIAMU|nr:hypothetical protein GMRT_12529 [Giardia muris]|eukprot:TNJ28397.1 hypothetical protein GMRT_12529 [Giardia muris]
MSGSSYRIDVLLTDKDIRSCVLTSHNDLYVLKGPGTLVRYALTLGHCALYRGSTTFTDGVISYVVYPEINMGLVHAGKTIHVLNVDTFQSVPISFLTGVISLVPHFSGYEPVYVRFPDSTQASNLPQGQRKLYYVPISTKPGHLQRALSQAHRPVLQHEHEHGLIDFIVIHERTGKGHAKCVSLVVCKSTELVKAFPLPVSSLPYQTLPIPYSDLAALHHPCTCNPLTFKFDCETQLKGIELVQLDLSETCDRYAWIGESLVLAEKCHIKGSLIYYALDIRKLVYLLALIEHATTVTESSNSLDGSIAKNTYMYLKPYVFTELAELPLKDYVDSDDSLLLIRPSYVDAGLKSALMNEINLRIENHEYMDRRFCRDYRSGTTMYSYSWPTAGHAVHCARTQTSAKHEVTPPQLVKQQDLTFLDDRDMHNRIAWTQTADILSRVNSSTSNLSRQGEGDTVISGNCTIRRLSDFPRICFQLLRDANNMISSQVLFSGGILEPKKLPSARSSPLITLASATSKHALNEVTANEVTDADKQKLQAPELFKYVQHLSRGLYNSLLLGAPVASLESITGKNSILDDSDMASMEYERDLKYCGAYLPLPVILRIHVGHDNYVFINTEINHIVPDPNENDHYAERYNGQGQENLFAYGPLYKLAVPRRDLLTLSTTSLQLVRLIRSADMGIRTPEMTDPLGSLTPTVVGRPFMPLAIIPAHFTGNTLIYGLSKMYYGEQNTLPCDTPVFYIVTANSVLLLRRSSLFTSLLDDLRGEKKTVTELVVTIENKLSRPLSERFDMSQRDWTLCWVVLGALRLSQRDFSRAAFAFVNARLLSPILTIYIMLHGLTIRDLAGNDLKPFYHTFQALKEMGSTFGCFQEVLDMDPSTPVDELFRRLYDFMDALSMNGDYIRLPPSLEPAQLLASLHIEEFPGSVDDRLDACLLYLKIVLDPTGEWNLALHGLCRDVDEEKVPLAEHLVNECIEVRNGHKHKHPVPTAIGEFHISHPAPVHEAVALVLRSLMLILLLRPAFHVAPKDQLLLLRTSLNPGDPFYPLVSSREVSMDRLSNNSDVYASAIGLLTILRRPEVALALLRAYLDVFVTMEEGELELVDDQTQDLVEALLCTYLSLAQSTPIPTNGEPLVPEAELARFLDFYTLSLRPQEVLPLVLQSFAYLAEFYPRICLRFLKREVSGSDYLSHLLKLEVASGYLSRCYEPVSSDVIEHIVHTLPLEMVLEYIGAGKQHEYFEASLMHVLLNVVASCALSALRRRTTGLSVIENSYISTKAAHFIRDGLMAPALRHEREANDFLQLHQLLETLDAIVRIDSLFSDAQLQACLLLNRVGLVLDRLMGQSFPGSEQTLTDLVLRYERKDPEITPYSTRQPRPTSENPYPIDRKAFAAAIEWCLTATSQERDDDLAAARTLMEDCFSYQLSLLENITLGDVEMARVRRSPVALIHSVLVRLCLLHNQGLITHGDFAYCFTTLIDGREACKRGTSGLVCAYLSGEVLKMIPQEFPMKYLVGFLTNTIAESGTVTSLLDANLMTLQSRQQQVMEDLERCRGGRLVVNAFSQCKICGALINPALAASLVFLPDGAGKIFPAHPDCYKG